ncbi:MULTISPECIES: helix-turn-helix domain-containing protein [Actinosynnema]|uniref:winged helix-turn-helix transcriptional regulator n=1 Tax=Actinosynnema TaxID=40566 RepID=UPI0020A47179|nr:helix-turn-helix domain-containing protein [Actinosynnema pretiosum]MCP2094955.1 transcriptional regulator, HxlR family [Actinosynnema pretiosum]
MRRDTRSTCPVNLSLEIFGDRWTLLVLRDVAFLGARHFRELLAGPERISSNILADRLAVLVEHGMLTRSGDPSHRQKVVYSLTERSIALVPVFAQLGIWGVRHLGAGDEYAARTGVLASGGPALWEEFMDELRETHLGPAARLAPRGPGPSVGERLDRAYLAALAEVEAAEAAEAGRAEAGREPAQREA